MFPTLRKYLIIVLTILQLFAPLVHAHASDAHSHQGFHVPGLEHYNSHPESITYLKAPALQSCVDGVMVGVGVGLKQTSSAAQADPDNSDYLLMQIPPLSKVVLPLKSYDSGLAQALLARLLASPPPSRCSASA